MGAARLCILETLDADELVGVGQAPGELEEQAAVLGGRLALGTWQSIAFVDLNIDNPDRQVRLSFLG